MLINSCTGPEMESWMDLSTVQFILNNAWKVTSEIVGLAVPVFDAYCIDRF